MSGKTQSSNHLGNIFGEYKMSTVSVQDIEWTVQCSNCDYENHYKRMIGESIGSVFDQMLLQFLEPCVRCKGIKISNNTNNMEGNVE